MRNLTAFLLFYFASITVFSQPICNFDNVHGRRLQKDPQYKKAVEENEKFVQRYIAKYKNRLSARTQGLNSALYTIPVVVHVMHTGGAIGTIYNPTDAQIQGAINYLNQVYNGSYPGTQGIGDIQIQFALAAKDPNCNSTTGIERINASGISGYSANGVSSNPGISPGVDESLIKDMSRWNSFQYYNIWIVNKIDGKDGTSGQFIAGYAYLPGPPSSYDGTIMLATQMVTGQKTLPHEIGHAFGLLHPFEGSPDKNTCSPNTGDCNIDNDMVCDTDPITFNQIGNVVDFSCRTGINPCTGTPYNNNTESNYMNYTTCYNLFTTGQKARMLAFAASPYRKSLSTSLALVQNFVSSSFSPPIAASCTPTTGSDGLNGYYAGILNTELNNHSLGSSFSLDDNGYVNGANSCLNLIQLVRGNSYTISVSVSGANPEQVRAWIDFNNDGAFSNSTEQVMWNATTAPRYPVATSATFTVPATAALNTVVRMRIIDDIGSISSGCTNPVYGQAEDYPVYISSGVLPVRLSEFNGNLKNNSVGLYWKTELETGVRNFDIEKSSDGIEFIKIGSVLASGESSVQREYRFTDNYLVENNYYRLRVNDINGSSKLSEVVLLRYNATKQNVRVINNPFTNAITITFDKAASLAQFQLLNAYGAVVAEKSMSVSAGYLKWDLPNTLPRGTYVLKVLADGQMFTAKLIRD